MASPNIGMLFLLLGLTVPLFLLALFNIITFNSPQVGTKVPNVKDKLPKYIHVVTLSRLSSEDKYCIVLAMLSTRH
ncbi:hypothetical protein F5Y12DRAFT_754871 [Xylaria sp. FL1777]|nr:hypothetical protein F5Y12DRAFT_754871 [Xylaria sp. FL1777]